MDLSRRSSDNNFFLLITTKGRNSALKLFQEKLEYIYSFFSCAKSMDQIWQKLEQNWWETLLKLVKKYQKGA